MEARFEMEMVPVTPENSESKDGTRRNSIGKANLRGSASPSRNDLKPLPHYLMASPPSVHDFCKYGHKHAFEGEEKHLSYLNFSGRTRSLVEQKGSTILERMKNRGNNLKTSSKLTNKLSNKPKAGEREARPTSQETGSSEETSEKESTGFSKQVTSHSLAIINASPKAARDLLKDPTSSKDDRSQAIRLQISWPITSSAKAKVVERKDSSPASEDNDDSGDLNSVKNARSIKKADASAGPVLVKQRSRSTVRIPSLNARTRSLRRKADLFSAPDEDAVSLKPKTSPVKSPSPADSSDDLSAQGDKEKTVKNVDESKITQNKDLDPFTFSSPALAPAPVFSSSKPKPYIKRIASIKKRTVGKAVNNSKRASDETLPSLQESNSLDSKSGASKDEDKRILRRTGTVRRDEESASAYKVKFRNGPVVDLPPESTAPVKLKFNRGRVLESSSGNVGAMWRRSFSRKSSRRRGMAGVVYNDPETGKQVVVLRHQDVQKKDDQGLFNNVIEETATNLVKSRKSKVKALVGAFETVFTSFRGSK